MCIPSMHNPPLSLSQYQDALHEVHWKASQLFHNGPAYLKLKRIREGKKKVNTHSKILNAKKLYIIPYNFCKQDTWKTVIARKGNNVIQLTNIGTNEGIYIILHNIENLIEWPFHPSQRETCFPLWWRRKEFTSSKV